MQFDFPVCCLPRPQVSERSDVVVQGLAVGSGNTGKWMYFDFHRTNRGTFMSLEGRKNKECNKCGLKSLIDSVVTA